MLICAIAAALGVTVSIGWLTGTPELYQLWMSSQHVTRFTTGLCFILVAVGIACGVLERTRQYPAYYVRLCCSWIVSAVGLVLIADYILPEWWFEIAKVLDPEKFRASFNTALGLAALGISLHSPPLGTQGAPNNRWGTLVLWCSQLSAIVAMIIGYAAVIGHVYNADFLFRFSQEVNISFPSACIVMMLGLASLLREPQAAIARDLTSRMLGGRFMRVLMIIATVLVPCMGLVPLWMHSSGIAELELGIALFTAVNVVVLAAALWLTARRLNIAQEIQYATQNDLQQLNATLEGRVKTRTMELQVSEAQFRLLAETAPALIWMSNPALRLIYINRSYSDFYEGIESTSMELHREECIHPDDRQMVNTIMKHALAHNAPFERIFRVKGKEGGEYRWIHERAVPRVSTQGEFLGYIGTGVDVTDSQLARETLRVALEDREYSLLRERQLRRELDHRVRNNLTSLLGLVSFYETGHQAPSSELYSALRDKIRAMKDVHDLIARAGGSRVSLSDLLSRVLSVMIPDPIRERVSLIGSPGFYIFAQQASAFAMIIQELTTNSFKHGSLGATGGEVTLTWGINPEVATSAQTPVEPAALIFTWSEKHASPRAAPFPAAAASVSGLGLRLIEGFARSDLRGIAKFHSHPEGWQCEIQTPMFILESATHADNAGLSTRDVSSVP